MGWVLVTVMVRLLLLLGDVSDRLEFEHSTAMFRYHIGSLPIPTGRHRWVPYMVVVC